MPAPVDGRLTLDAAWSLAGRLSPRAVVRVADVDAAGRAVNRYGAEMSTAGPVPGVPWAVCLADRSHRFRLLGFDLDAKHASVLPDLHVLLGLLAHERLPVVVCASGPGGGRHVWVALAEPVPARLARRLALGLALLLPTFDPAQLTNAVSGALRPPGAPHRAGGSSSVVVGDPWSLLTPAATATVAAVERLVTEVERRAIAISPPGATSASSTSPTSTDGDGYPYLRGVRRGSLPAAAHTAAWSPLPRGADLSDVLFSVLCGAARASWRYADVLALLDRAPGLEHARTARDPHAARGTGTGRSRAPRRSPRPPSEQLEVLARQWDRAVAFVAAVGGGTGADPDWDTRVAEVVEQARRVQLRADASPGRWARRAGPNERKVLDLVCLLALAAVSPHVELDIRRAALATGIGRETARRALITLAAEGWLTLTETAHGVRAAVYALPVVEAAARREPDTQSSTGNVDPGGSQVVPRAPGSAPHQVPLGTLTMSSPAGGPAPTPARMAWLHRLQSSLESQVHDVFVPVVVRRSGEGAVRGLGHHASRLYARLAGSGEPTVELARQLGYSTAWATRLLHRLAEYGLARYDTRDGWRRTAMHLQRTGGRLADSREAAADRLGTTGALVDRAQRYRLEQLVWAWWHDELTWRRAPRGAKPWRRSPAGSGQTVLQLGAQPLCEDGAGQTVTAPGRAILGSLHRDHGRYPVHRTTGRGDHAAAKAVIAKDLDQGHTGSAVAAA